MSSNKNDRKLIVNNNPKSVAAEAFRTLRTNLRFTAPDKELKKIMLTSTGLAEGKSTISCNLAISICQTDKKVIMIDCDMRKPVLHQIFGVDNVYGLSNIITGQITLEEALKDTSVDGLQLITSGPTPPNPSELLQSQAMKDLIDQLDDFDGIVVLDTPPVLPVADSLILGPMCDGVAFVVAANQTHQEAVLRARDLLLNSKSRLLGVILNKVEFKGRSYEYYYYNYYTSLE